LLKNEGLLSEIEFKAIKEAELQGLDLAALSAKIANELKTYRENGLREVFIDILISTHLLPWKTIERLQRTYNLGRDTDLIKQALNHPNVEAWIKRVQEIQLKKGKLDFEKHLQRYNPQARILTLSERKTLASMLENYKNILEILLQRSVKIVNVNYHVIDEMMSGWTSMIEVVGKITQLPKQGQTITLKQGNFQRNFSASLTSSRLHSYF